MNSEHIAMEIIESNHYLCLGTTSVDLKPWTAPLAYVYSEEKNIFYFISHPETTHIQHITSNPEVGFSIFDSKQKPWTAFGIQGSGVVTKVFQVDIPEKLRGKLLSLVSMVILSREHNFYALELRDLYVPNTERWKEEKPLRTKAL